MSNQIIIKYKQKKTTLEIVCDKSYLKNYRLLNNIKSKRDYIPKLLIIDTIFSNYKKGTIANSGQIHSVCNSTDKTDAIIFILDNGVSPLSSDERKQLVNQKRTGIMHYFVSNYLDPVGKKPHPASRIDNALKSIKGLVIDPHKPVELQANEIYKKIKYIITLVKNSLTTTVELSHSQLGKGLTILHKYSTILNENYHTEGATFEIETTKNDYEHIINFIGYDNKSKSEDSVKLSKHHKKKKNKYRAQDKQKDKSRDKSKNKFKKHRKNLSKYNIDI